MLVETNYGKIEGIEADGCYIYKGIPYAKPPVGKLRFARPQKPDAWEGVYRADRFRCKSIQRREVPGSFYQKEFYDNPEFSVPVSEDCLYLNIWRPASGGKGKLPVAVYVHGGAFMGGAGSNLPFVGNYFAERGIVLVTINYRLGVWGFLSHPLLASGTKSRGNYGLWDQIAAFIWVKENIAAFGGDPENVTAFGQSAGAMSLQILALSPVAKGLFQRMILQSGGGYHNPLANFRTQERADEFGEQLLAELGIDSWRSGADCQAAEEKLYVCKAEDLQEAAGRVLGNSFQAGTGFVFMPVIDGELLTDGVDALIERGNYHDIPYILGANANDITTEQIERPTQENNPMHLANVEYAKRVNQSNTNDCYVYYFARRLPSDESGAFHSAELWYVFGSLDYCWREMEERDRRLSEEMMACWCSFMRSGNPNGESAKGWRPCTKEDGFVKIFE